ncbi:hypothetical protein B0H14DRAFT_3525922 [Mycena olivaceomarginata]|nr:hypothetical protein B0H14DRAFT_3525922 [Mycena olivaceomarginata]
MPFNTVLNMTLALRKTYGINPRVLLPPVPVKTASFSSIINTSNSIATATLRIRLDRMGSFWYVFFELSDLFQLAHRTVSGCDAAIPQAYRIRGIENRRQITSKGTTRLAARFLQLRSYLARARRASARRSSAASSGRGPRLVDVDLQHPPSAIPTQLGRIDVGADGTGTGYGRGVVMDASWPLYHRLISWARTSSHAR